MHHKKKRAKKQRAGCLLCKPHKMNGACAHNTNMRHGNRRRYETGTDQLKFRCERIED